MNKDPSAAPLLKWTELARKNAENAIVGSMLNATLRASAPIAQFSTWLLVATAAIASFLIGNATTLMPIISQSGFRWCGTFLIASCLFGLLAKVFALRCTIGSDVASSVTSTFLEHLAKYELEEGRIHERARLMGITVQTELRLDKMIEDYLKPMPRVVAWSARAFFKKHASNPNIEYLSQIRSLNAQGECALAQALFFLCFLAAGFVFAAPF